MPDPRLRSVVAADLDMSEVVDLYTSVGWTAYTNQPELLTAALTGSSHIVAAHLEAALVGLARVISDSASIAYLQDVLVHPTRQRHGVGAALVRTVLRPYEHVRQKVLLTDDEPGAAGVLHRARLAQHRRRTPTPRSIEAQTRRVSKGQTRSANTTQQSGMIISGAVSARFDTITGASPTTRPNFTILPEPGARHDMSGDARRVARRV